MPKLSFWVEGKPVTQGSMNPGRNGKMFHKASLQPWRDKVWEAAVIEAQSMGYMDDALDNPVIPVPKYKPVSVSCVFWFARPLSPSYDFPARADVDKLQRAIGDALSVPKKGRLPIITDDDQITTWAAVKAHTNEIHPNPGADITITW